MRMYDIIDKKKKGKELSKSEIEYFVYGYTKNKIPDYQASALLMAIYFREMSDRELIDLTDAMAHSGNMADLSAIDGIKADKHSTGGVGDKTTLAVVPIVAACGGKVAKMSGRGLGFTGGTIDKLESIPGFNSAISQKRFFEIINSAGASIIGQSLDFAPADKKMYALRDVTATVDSIPLIAASIMSKKLAAGSDVIVLDVTVGSGAFMKNIKDALKLAKKMVAIGEGAGRKTVAYITNMDVPLGTAAGNIMEVKEAIEALKGNGSADFLKICKTFAASMLNLSNKGSIDECMAMVEKSIANGEALDKFAQIVKEQGGDEKYIYNPSLFETAKYSLEWMADDDLNIVGMNAEQCGKAAVVLGAGRNVKDDKIDFAAGIEFYKKTGDFVKRGETVAALYSSDEAKLKKGLDCLKQAYSFGHEDTKPNKSIMAYVSNEETIIY